MRHVELEKARPGPVCGADVFDRGTACCGQAVGEFQLAGDFCDGGFAGCVVDFVDADGREADGCVDFVPEDGRCGVALVCVD